MYKFINKSSLIGVINQSLAGREAGLLAGMLLGDKSGFDKQFYEYLKNSGLVHIVVASGSNVTLIGSSLIERLAKWLGRKKAIGMGLGVVWGYGFLVGWEAPIMRAVLLISVYYWAQFLGRKYDWGRGLGLAVAIMLVADWRMVTEVGFWLSLAAFIGVVTFDRISNNRIPITKQFQTTKNQLIMEFSKTLWVSLWATPVLALVFGKISLVGPVLNVLVLGVVEVITAVGAIGVLVGRVIPVLGKMVLWVILPLLKYFVAVVGWGGKWPGLTVEFNWLMLIGWYLVLGAVLLKKAKE